MHVVKDLPAAERARVQRRLEKFYAVFAPGSFNADAVQRVLQSCPVDEGTMIAKLCDKYSVSVDEERIFARALLPTPSAAVSPSSSIRSDVAVENAAPSKVDEGIIIVTRVAGDDDDHINNSTRSHSHSPPSSIAASPPDLRGSSPEVQQNGSSHHHHQQHHHHLIAAPPAPSPSPSPAPAAAAAASTTPSISRRAAPSLAFTSYVLPIASLPPSERERVRLRVEKFFTSVAADRRSPNAASSPPKSPASAILNGRMAEQLDEATLIRRLCTNYADPNGGASAAAALAESERAAAAQCGVDPFFHFSVGHSARASTTARRSSVAPAAPTQICDFSPAEKQRVAKRLARFYRAFVCGENEDGDGRRQEEEEQQHQQQLMLSRVAEVDMDEAAFFGRICESFGVDPALERSEADAAGSLSAVSAAVPLIEEDDDSEENLRRLFESLVADEKQQGAGCNGCGAPLRLHDRNAIFGAVLRWFPLKCASPGHAFERVRRCSRDGVDFSEFVEVMRDAISNVAA